MRCVLPSTCDPIGRWASYCLSHGVSISTWYICIFVTWIIHTADGAEQFLTTATFDHIKIISYIVTDNSVKLIKVSLPGFQAADVTQFLNEESGQNGDGNDTVILVSDVSLFDYHSCQ